MTLPVLKILLVFLHILNSSSSQTTSSNLYSAIGYFIEFIINERGTWVDYPHSENASAATGTNLWLLDVGSLDGIRKRRVADPIWCSQIANVLEAEGVRWYQEKTYFTECPDPQFAQKRGRL
jgi:hypothetical protein